MLSAKVISFISLLGLANDIIFGHAASTISPPRSYRTPHPTTLNSDNNFNAGVKTRQKSGDNIRNIDLLVDHAEFALNSYLPSAEILSSLRRTKSNVRIIQRTLDHVGASYNIIQYSEKSSDDVRWVISIPGSRNNKNMQQNMDNKLVLDEILNIKMHRGYRSVYRAILADFIQEETKIRGLLSQIHGEGETLKPKNRINLSVTGHSLGGAVSVLFAAALQTRGYAIDHVTVFGTPKFTDKKGAMQLAGSLPIERVEHVMDPVSISPMGVPLPFPFVDNYADLESEALLILVPADKSTSRASDRSRENDAKARGVGLGGRENEGDNAFNLLQSVLQNPLSALSEFNWRGERMMEQLQKHHVYAGREAIRRTGALLRIGDVFGANWQWHSMRAYHSLLKEYQAEYKQKGTSQQI